MSRGESTTPATFENLAKFLQTRIQTLAALENNSQIKLHHAIKKENFKDLSKSSPISSPQGSKQKVFHSTKQTTTLKCVGS